MGLLKLTMDRCGRGIEETIAAIATPPGRGAIGVIRISGPEALSILGRIWRGASPPAGFEDRRVYRGRILEIDQALAFVMRAPRSYTGEDLVEIQAHGGPRVLEMILEAVVKGGHGEAAEARLARPGEFTERAFLNGKMDLAQAEAVADLIAASSAEAARAAARQLSGGLSQKVNRLRNDLKVMRAQMEAMIDFPEDEDVQGLKSVEIADRLEQIRGTVERLVESYREGRALREGIRVAIVGKPNVGKSSLLNALLQEERAIVHPSPGTTRDTVEEQVEIGGLPIRLIDTAGIRGKPEEVEAEGIRRTRERIGGADLVLLVVDSNIPLDREDEEVFEAAQGRETVFIYNKIDQPPAFPPGRLSDRLEEPTVLPISALTHEGLAALRDEIRRRFVPRAGSEEVVLTNVRHRVALEKSIPHLARVREGALAGISQEFLVADLTPAIDTLSEVTGEITTDEVLGEIFSRFCLGK